jgi:hypothetical protein
MPLARLEPPDAAGLIDSQAIRRRRLYVSFFGTLEADCCGQVKL